MASGQAGTSLERAENQDLLVSHPDEEEVFGTAPAVLTDRMRLLTIAQTGSTDVENL